MPLAWSREKNSVDLEPFVADFAVEVLDEPVSPGLTKRDEDPLRLTSPLADRDGGRFWPVCHPESFWHAPL